MSIVYFIQSGNSGPIKIGVASSLNLRLRALQNGNPEKLRCLLTVPGGRDLEQTLHAAFRSTRVRLEWFKPDQRLQAVIEALRGNSAEQALSLARSLAALAKRHEAETVAAAVKRAAAIEKLVPGMVARVVGSHGADKVGEVMGFGARSARNAAQGRTIPKGSALFNLLLLDGGALDEAFALTGFRPVALTARIARAGVA